MNVENLKTIVPSSVKLINKNGMEVIISSVGATVISLKVPNKFNELTNVVLGLEKEEEYLSEEYLEKRVYLGSTVGRYAGRISNKSFSINGERFLLHHDENNVHLHGGKIGFDKKIWKVKEIEKNNKHPYKVTFSYNSKHLEEGYPGNVKINAIFHLTDDNDLHIVYTAVSDKHTHINITNHNYYNLNGENSILNHKLQLECNKYLEVDDNLIPTGETLFVDNTKFDYNKLKKINENGFSGLDDTFIFKKDSQKVTLISEFTGIKMAVATNQPAVVVYTPLNLNFLSFSKNAKYLEYPAICFEAQKYPDSPNNPNFPSTLVKPNEEYRNETILSFSIIK